MRGYRHGFDGLDIRRSTFRSSQCTRHTAPITLAIYGAASQRASINCVAAPVVRTLQSARTARNKPDPTTLR